MLDLILALQTTPAMAAECEVVFLVGNRRASDIEIDCSENADQGAYAAAREAVDWRRPVSLGRFARDIRARDTLELERSADGHWIVTGELLFRVPPQYPVDAFASSDIACCRARFDVVNGRPHVHAVNCNTGGNEHSFARATQQAIEKWVYTRGYNRQCLLTTINFELHDEQMEHADTNGRPADPPCPE